MLVCTLLNACSTYSPLVDTMGRSGTFDESRAEHFSNDKVICEQIATNNTTFFGNIGFWIMSPEAKTEHDYIYNKSWAFVIKLKERDNDKNKYTYKRRNR
jgi:hypothetical protein